MSAAAQQPLVAHVDDAREWTEFGDGPDGDAVWYLHRQTTQEGAAATLRCGLFRVAPVASELTLPYHETIVTLAGEGRTTAGDRAVEIAPGRQLFVEAGTTASFAPRTANLEFITVVEVGGTADELPAPATGLAVLDDAAPAALHTAAPAPKIGAGTVRLAVGEHDERHACDRTLCVLDGEGELLLDDGTRRQVRAGTIAFLPRGRDVRWQVRRTLRAFVTEVA